MTIPTNLIERALSLTGKSIESVCYDYWSEGDEIIISIEKFSYFLLSPEFIGKYHNLTADTINCHIVMTAEFVGMCIWQYQSGDPGPLIDLLTKIPGTPTTTHH